MKELVTWLWNMPSEQLLTLLEALFLKFFTVWVIWIVLKLMWKKVMK